MKAELVGNRTIITKLNPGATARSIHEARSGLLLFLTLFTLTASRPLLYAAPCTLNCPNLTVCNDPFECGATVNYTNISSSGDCRGVVCTPLSGSFFEIGPSNVTCIATDPTGHTVTCSFIVTVNDCEMPTISCSTNITTCNDAGRCGAVVTFFSTAADNCPDTLATSCSPASGSTFPIGTTKVTCTAKDLGGNSAQCSFTVTVQNCTASTGTIDCVMTTNPSGRNIPTAGNNPRSGKNPDGFYLLIATDCTGAGLPILIKDSAEGPCGGAFQAGPYPTGTKVKLTQSPGHASVQPMAGAITAHIHTRGDPVLVVTDSSGNTRCHLCFIPPPPK